MSVSGHRGEELSRRDDLESLGLVFLYFKEGKLPWQGTKKLKGKEDEFHERLAQEKQDMMMSKDLPKELQKYFAYVCRLRFDQKPDYRYLWSLFSQEDAGQIDDGKLDLEVETAGGQCRTITTQTASSSRLPSRLTRELARRQPLGMFMMKRVPCYVDRSLKYSCFRLLLLLSCCELPLSGSLPDGYRSCCGQRSRL